MRKPRVPTPFRSIHICLACEAEKNLLCLPETIIVLQFFFLQFYFSLRKKLELVYYVDPDALQECRSRNPSQASADSGYGEKGKIIY